MSKWSVDTATTTRSAVTSGDVVVAASGPKAKGDPHGVVALSTATGEQLWSGPDEAVPVAIVDGLAWVGTPSGLVALELSTGAERWRVETVPLGASLLAGTTVLGNDEATIIDPATGHVLRSIQDVTLGDGDQAQAVVLQGSSLEEFDPVTGATGWTTTELGTDDVYTTVQSVEVAAQTVVVMLSSPVGPDRRAVVYDASTGRPRFTLDGVRDTAIAEGVLLADVRVESDTDELPRELRGYDSTTGRQLWSAPSSGRLGGLVAIDGTHAVFAGSSGLLSVRVVPGPTPGTRFIATDRPDDVMPNPQVVIGPNTLALVATSSGSTVQGVLADSGTVEWTWTAQHPVVSIQAATDGQVLVTASDIIGVCM